MDHIYPTKDYKVYKIKDEVKKLSAVVMSSELPNSFEDVAKAVGVSEEKLKKTSLELCKYFEDYGTVRTDVNASVSAPDPFKSFPEEALELNCVKALRDGNIVFKEKRLKDEMKKLPEKLNAEADLEAFKNSVITVRFYEPFRYTPCMKNQPRFHQEYHVLGSNLLSDLRDRFYCHCNYGPFFDISDDPHNVPEHDFDPTNPGFFFIHNTFYNDTRNAADADYSELILKWFKRFDYVGELKTGIMQDTKFEDLEIRFGYPCVYQHHGACEHIFCITSVNLLDNSDSLVEASYPTLIATGRKRSTLCEICGQTDASFLVTNCALHVKDPLKVCGGCFFSFHYESDGVTKTCSFNAYRIFSVRPEKS